MKKTIDVILKHLLDICGKITPKIIIESDYVVK